MKILVFTKNWLGDVLFEIPALRALRENFPSARIAVLAPARCREILESVPFLDEVRVFDERAGERSLLAKLRLIAWLRREKFEKVFLFHRSFTRALLAWWGGVPERIGYRTEKRGWVLTRAVEPPRKPLHHVDYSLCLLKGAGLRVRFGSEYEFFHRPEEETQAAQILKMNGLESEAFVAFHIGANWEPKRWPASHFAKLADRIGETYQGRVVLTGSEEDERIARDLVRQCESARPISLCGKTSLGILGALYRKAVFVVSSDSGPLHIASGVGTPVVAIFGPTSPELTGPRGPGKKIVIHFVLQGETVPWLGKKLPAGGWMERISAEAVFQRIQEEKLWGQKKEILSSSSR
jgi:lipopolysaccharide heptosyltransferase II